MNDLFSPWWGQECRQQTSQYRQRVLYFVPELILLSPQMQCFCFKKSKKYIYDGYLYNKYSITKNKFLYTVKIIVLINKSQLVFFTIRNIKNCLIIVLKVTFCQKNLDNFFTSQKIFRFSVLNLFIQYTTLIICQLSKNLPWQVSFMYRCKK